MDSLHPNKASSGYVTYCIISGVLTILATVCVALRFLQRMRTIDLWWDDWTILLSLIFLFGIFITDVLLTVPSLGGAGYHVSMYTTDQLNTWSKVKLAAEVLYNPGIAFAKVSVLLFYRRIFSVDGHFLLFMRAMILLVVASCVAATFVLIFEDNPVQAQWNTGMAHTSINFTAFVLAMAIINVLWDVAIIGMVQGRIWNLNLDTKRKLLVSLLMILGTFSIVASILRVVYFYKVDWDDPTYTLKDAGLWTNIESILYIICACLPVIYNLFRSKLRTGSKGPTGRRKESGHGLVTIGSGPSRLKRYQYDYGDEDNFLNGPGYDVLCEHGPDGETQSMRSLDPVRVRSEFKVTRDHRPMV